MSVEALTGTTSSDFNRPFVTMYFQLPREREMELEGNRDLQDQYTEEIAAEMHGKYGGRNKPVRVRGVRVTAGAGWLFPVHVELQGRNGKTTIYPQALDEMHDEVVSLVQKHIGEDVTPYSDIDYSEIEVKV